MTRLSTISPTTHFTSMFSLRASANVAPNSPKIAPEAPSRWRW